MRKHLQVVGPWLDLTTSERLHLVASYFHFAGSQSEEESGAISKLPGQLFDRIESIELVPEASVHDPLWIVRARRVT